MRHDVYDGHQSRDPADHQHHHAVLIRQVLVLRGEGGEVSYQGDTLGHVCDSISETDTDVEEYHFEDNKSGEGAECSIIRIVPQAGPAGPDTLLGISLEQTLRYTAGIRLKTHILISPLNRHLILFCIVLVLRLRSEVNRGVFQNPFRGF